MPIRCLQGNKGTFPLHGTLSQNHIYMYGSITSAIAIYHVFLDNVASFHESPIVQFVRFSKSFGFLIIPPAPFRSGDLWEYVRKIAWRLSTVTEPASVSRPSNVFASVFCNLQNVVKSRCRDLQRNTFCPQQDTILNSEKALVRVTSS